MELANFIYTSFVGMLNQWLAVRDASLFVQAMNNLIEAAQEKACASRHPDGSVKQEITKGV